MNFTHLKNAVTAARLGSINKAAAELYISQPCLSNSLKALEKELDFQVFVRSHSGIQLTDKGKRFILLAEDILKDYEKILELSENRDIKPLLVSSYPLSYLSGAFLRFRKKTDSKLNDQIREEGNFKVMEDVAQGRSVLGFVFFSAAGEKKLFELAEGLSLRCERLFVPVSMYAVAGKSHPIAKYKKISLDGLLKYPIVSFSDKSSRNFLLSLKCRMNRNSFFTTDRVRLFDALRSGEYASLLSVSEQTKSSDYAYVPIDDERLKMGIYYLVRKDYHLDKRERGLLDYFKKEITLL